MSPGPKDESSEDDDEALSWAGGETDTSYVANPEPVRPLRGPTKAPRERRAQVAAEVDEYDGAPPMSSAVLLSLGVLGGVYLLYSAGWIISFGRLLYASTNTLDDASFHIQQVVAIVAPALWFAGVFWLTRDRPDWVRLVWLLVGAILLVPWSFVFGT